MRPPSTYNVFPQPNSSNNARRKSKAGNPRSRRLRYGSSQIQIRRHNFTEFWKVVRPMDPATVTTRLYHEVLKDICRDDERSSGSGSNGEPTPPESPAQVHQISDRRMDGYGRVTDDTSSSDYGSPPRAQYPPREDSLLPPPVAYTRQEFRERLDRNRRLGFVPPEQIQRQMQHELDGDRTTAPLNFSRLHTKSLKSKTATAYVASRQAY